MRVTNRVKRLLVSHEHSKRKYAENVKDRERQKYIEKGARVEKAFRDEVEWVGYAWEQMQNDREA
jgi:hypothetical protein